MSLKCADGESISQLRRAIEHEAAEMLTPNELFPAEWWAVKQRLGAMNDARSLIRQLFRTEATLFPTSKIKLLPCVCTQRAPKGMTKSSATSA
jgi:hypothetical protein